MLTTAATSRLPAGCAGRWNSPQRCDGEAEQTIAITAWGPAQTAADPGSFPRGFISLMTAYIRLDMRQEQILSICFIEIFYPSTSNLSDNLPSDGDRSIIFGMRRAESA
ncbi:MAG: hypothetical protein J0H11_01515 [Rhizobiales bacterium]|nr:hypothetical protein [Hyphomicrobiales bacterium]